jgi:hypothetical protein
MDREACAGFDGTAYTESRDIGESVCETGALDSAPFGEAVNVWVNPRGGTSMIETSIACTLGANGSLYTCSNRSVTYTVNAGDQVIVIVTPPSGETVSPVTLQQLTRIADGFLLCFEV